MKTQLKTGDRVFRIDRYRILNGLTQGQLAEKSGIKTTRIAVVEAFTHEELQAIAEALGIEETQLLYDAERS